MALQATYNGASVNILDIQPLGMDIFVIYVDASNNVCVTKSAMDRTQPFTILATSATVS